ncbi:MAG: beta-lactamase family protein [Alphaproteobacteria bacterium]|nr:beta-lactamase family protein [Alphaproteobacteria bacterium]
MVAGTTPVFGVCEDRFAALGKVFQRAIVDNSDVDDRELGACVSAVVNGKTVVDLWGGYLDQDRTMPWQRDTTVCVFSVTKAVAAFCIHVLHDRKVIDIDAPIAAYWPEFGQHGKEGITIRMVLSHQAGLLYTDDIAEGALWQSGAIERVLEAKSPEWGPGTAGGYHSFTFGPLIEAVVKRATGRTLGQLLRNDITGPLGLEFGIGLSDAENLCCSDFFTNEENGTINAFRHDKDSAVYRCWKALPRTESFNSEQWRKREFSSLNGHGNARSLARIFFCLANNGEIGGIRMLSSAHVDDISRPQWEGTDRFSEQPGRFNSGFQMSNELYPFGGRRDNYGFYGIGGSMAFCDPVNKLSFAYCRNNCIAGPAAENPVSLALVKALYESL